MADNIGKFLILLVSCILLSSFLYDISVETVLPKVDYTNKVSFKLAYLNYDDELIIAFKENSYNAEHTINKFDVKTSRFLNDYSFDLPYQYEPTLFLIFGEFHPVDFVLTNVVVNGTNVSIERIDKMLKKIGYKTTVEGGIVYAQHVNDVDAQAFDLYHLTDAFKHISNDELIEFLNQDKFLRFLYLISISVIILICLFIFLKFISINLIDKIVLPFSIVLYSGLIIFSFLLLYKDFNSIEVIDVLLFLKNNLIIILVPLIIYFYSSSFNKISKFIMALAVFLFLLFIGIDHFVQNVFGNRFLISYADTFKGNIKDGIPFFINYLLNPSGLYYILAMVVIIGMFFFNYDDISKKIKFICWGLVVVSSLSMVFGNTNKQFKYFNVFQVNVSGMFTDGDFTRPYENYKPYTIEQLEYKKGIGLNQKKNVIIVLVESLGCNATYLCGDDKNLSPYTQELAMNNVWFPNYYSNDFHTNGAIFSITTGYAFVQNANAAKTTLNRELYQYDLINKFKEQGYRTAYFSPAPLILGKEQQLQMSQYDYISYGSDPFYDSSKKNGVFNSANDEELFSKIINDVVESKDPVFFMTTTISTHTPYVVPWGSQNIELAYAYSDMAIKKFIKKLESIGYFDNGIVIITGDHIGWGSNNKTNKLNIDLHKVPLILINGKDHGVVIDGVSFSHTSLGVMLEYLMLPNYYKNKYQINPLLENNSNEIIIHYDTQQMNNVDVKYGDKVDEILLDGDHTRFLGSKFSEYEQKDILGYLSWIRR